MKIIVLVKEVPDTYGDRKLNLQTGLADRGASTPALDEIGERAVEVALSYADANAGTEVVVMAMSHDGAATTIRKGLAMGAGTAVQIADEKLLGADLRLTAQTLAAAIAKTGYDLVIAGNMSTDGSGGMIPAMIAEILGVVSATGLNTVQISADSVTGTRAIDGGSQTISAALPAVISITEALPEARFPNFKGIMAAKKKPFETLTLADLDVDADDLSQAHSIMLSVAERPPREAGMKIVDEGDAGEKLADFLVQNRLV